MLSRPASRALFMGRLQAARPAAATATATAALTPRRAFARPSLFSPSSSSRLPTGRRFYVNPPKPGDGPLMERRADRELPDVARTRFRWSRTMPWFILIVAASSVAIFNYQKSSSPVVASTLYALRTSPRARAFLGDEIYFKERIPWIGGEMNQLQGRIDVHFLVKGTRNTARMHFVSIRPTARGVFETLEWSLETEDGHKIDLLQDVGEGQDPFRGIQLLPDDYVDVAEELGLAPAGASEGAKATQSALASAAAAAAQPTPRTGLTTPGSAGSEDTRGFRQTTRR